MLNAEVEEKKREEVGFKFAASSNIIIKKSCERDM